MADLLKAKLNQYRNQGKIKPCAPKVVGKNVWFFAPIQGPHTATPAGKIMRQFFEHFGFAVLVELYVPSEFHEREDMSTQGRLGDIRGKPKTGEVDKIKKDAQQIANSL